MVFGSFFLFVAWLVVSSLRKSWKSGAFIDDEELIQSGKSDMVRTIAGFLSWIVIVAVFAYFTVYRYQLLDIDVGQIELPVWLDKYFK